MSKKSVKPVVEQTLVIDPAKAKAELDRDREERVQGFRKAMDAACSKYNCEVLARIEKRQSVDGSWVDFAIPFYHAKA